MHIAPRVAFTLALLAAAACAEAPATPEIVIDAGFLGFPEPDAGNVTSPVYDAGYTYNPPPAQDAGFGPDPFPAADAGAPDAGPLASALPNPLDLFKQLLGLLTGMPSTPTDAGTP